ncbi:hypothetical protein [Nonomuraea fuscirosea]|uniref:hypothetical protein n=1 Tax=Nonomuraea fuscirosea TaxID=1291556 RepID=UPI00342BCB98
MSERKVDHEFSAMAYAYQGEWAECLLAQGRAEGMLKVIAADMASSVLRVLGVRGIAVPEEVYKRVQACRDVVILKGWFGRAMEAKSVEDVFG